MQKKINKKGQVTFANTPNILLSFAVMAMVAAASVLALVGFRDGSSDANANTTITNGITGLLNFSAQLGTVGTMIGVGLLLLVVIGIFGFIGQRGFRGGGI